MSMITTRLSWFCWALATHLLLLSLTLFYLNKTILMEWHILNPLATHINLLLLLDPKGMLFAATVLTISANVFYFSSSYMEAEPFLNRFSMLVSLFIASMALLIFIPHMMCLLLGWDGLGLVSFALVIYYQNPKSLGAGMITALTNRIGDVMILIAIAWSLNQGHWTITNMFSNFYTSMVSMFIMIAAMTKSAQIPFSSWLPAAMAAPTPVSALVHSSTLVTAGVFLLIRFFSSISKVPLFTHTLLIMSTLTMLMAGITAMMETDMKKIIALSTLSQLGVMMMSLALKLNLLAFFHLITHALFKALLFICAGTMIHLALHAQDLRSMGNTSAQLPLTLSCMTTANLALCGFPFLAGFYSKDLILEMMLNHPLNMFIVLMALLATALTTSYSARLMLTACWSPAAMSPLHPISNSSSYSYTPMLSLSAMAIIAGSTLNWLMVPMMPHPSLPTVLKMTPILMVLLGTIIGSTIASSQHTSPSPLLNLPTPHLFSSSMWFLTPLSSQFIMGLPFTFAKTSSHILDMGWWEGLLPQNLHKSLTNLSHLHLPVPLSSPPSLITTSLIIAIPFALILLLL